MDKQDEVRVKPENIHILTCPFCKEDYIIPTIYRTHLAAHINFHSKNNTFICKICPEENLNLTNIAVHVEQLHSKRRRENPDSDIIKEIEQKNLHEKYTMISELSKHDKNPFPLELPY